MIKRYNTYYSKIDNIDVEKSMRNFESLMEKEGARYIIPLEEIPDDDSFFDKIADYNAIYFLKGVLIEQKGKEWFKSISLNNIETTLTSFNGTHLSPILRLLRSKFNKNF